MALAYALERPGRVLGIALVAVTTTSRAEIQEILARAHELNGIPAI